MDPNQPAPPSTQIPHHNLVESLFSDTGPEVALRWVTATASTSPNTHLTPAIFRALISHTLRAGTKADVDAAVDALQLAATLPVQCPGAPLGFTTQTPNDKRASILQEILRALSADEPLLHDGNVLSFYANAGHGCGDPAEFHSVNIDADGRPAQAIIVHPLQQVRLYALVHFVRYIASLVSMPNTRHKLGDLITYVSASNADTLFLSPFVNDLPRNVDRLHPDAIEALHHFYCAALSAVEPHVRDTVKSRLANSVISVAHDRPENVGRFFCAMQDYPLLLDTCRLCLRQRYGVEDKVDRPLTLKVLSGSYLAMDITPRKINSILPALFTGLIQGWIRAPDIQSIRVSHKDALRCMKRANIMLNALTSGQVEPPPSPNDQLAMQVVFQDFLRWLVGFSE